MSSNTPEKSLQIKIIKIEKCILLARRWCCLKSTMLWLNPDWKETPRPLTDTQGEVKDAESDVQPEEEDDVGHFAEQKHVAYVLLQCDCGWEKKTKPWMQHDRQLFHNEQSTFWLLKIDFKWWEFKMSVTTRGTKLQLFGMLNIPMPNNRWGCQDCVQWQQIEWHE